MTCYVDAVRGYPEAGLRFDRYCHLLADTVEELHAMAATLGMPRKAFQDHPWRWHYDLPDFLRERAVQLGSVEVDMHAVGTLLRQRRAATASATPGPRPLRQCRRHDISGSAGGMTFPAVPET